MIQRAAAFAGLLALGFIGVSSASAQPYYYGYGAPRYYYSDGLPPQQIMRIIRQAGFAPLSAPVRRGPAYIVVAADPAGAHVRVAINAYEGDIVSVRPVVAMQLPPYGVPGSRLYDPPAPVGVPPHEIKDPPPGASPPARGPAYGRSGSIGSPTPPLPPRGIPNARLANAPPASASAPPTSAAPARTPIPRPRPSVAANDTPSPSPASASPAAPQATAPAARPVEAPTETESPSPAAKPSAPKAATPLVPVAPLDE